MEFVFVLTIAKQLVLCTLHLVCVIGPKCQQRYFIVSSVSNSTFTTDSESIIIVFLVGNNEAYHVGGHKAVAQNSFYIDCIFFNIK